MLSGRHKSLQDAFFIDASNSIQTLLVSDRLEARKLVRILRSRREVVSKMADDEDVENHDNQAEEGEVALL